MAESKIILINLYPHIVANLSQSTLKYKAAKRVPNLKAREIEGMLVAIKRYKIRREEELRMRAHLKYKLERSKAVSAEKASKAPEGKVATQSRDAVSHEKPSATITSLAEAAGRTELVYEDL